jgi:predicted ATPase
MEEPVTSIEQIERALALWESQDVYGADRQVAALRKAVAALAFYSVPENWRTPSTGFAVQYDPLPSPVAKAGNAQTAAAALAEIAQILTGETHGDV